MRTTYDNCGNLIIHLTGAELDVAIIDYLDRFYHSPPELQGRKIYNHGTVYVSGMTAISCNVNVVVPKDKL